MNLRLRSLLAGLALLPLSSFAQQYVPLLDSTRTWNTSRQCAWGGQNDCITHRFFTYSLHGDSVIGNETYTKVRWQGSYYEWSQGGAVCDNNTHYFNDFHSLVRESNKQVWRYDQNGPEELIYDFNLSVGDTLPDTYMVTIGSIDSVLIGSTYHKRFNLVDGMATYIVEGIGTDLGLFEPKEQVFECGWSQNATVCEDGLMIWPATNHGDTCPAVITSIEQMGSALENTLTVYPNPTQGTLNVSLPSISGNNGMLQVYQIDGRLLMQQSVSAEQTTLDVSTLPSGSYLLIYQDNDLLQTKRFTRINR